MKVVAVFVTFLCSVYCLQAMGMDLGDLEGRRLKQGEVKQLLADQKWTEDNKLTNFFGKAKTYVHPENNYVLSVDWKEKGGMLFLDKAAVYCLVADSSALQSKHMLDGIFSYGQDFPAQAQALSERFFKDIFPQLEESITAYSMESLRHIDEYMSTRRREKLLQPSLFPGLIAYIGESVKKNYSMEWNMVKVKDDLWEPWLVDRAGNEYPIFATAYRELYEYRPKYSSIYGAILGEIEKNKL